MKTSQPSLWPEFFYRRILLRFIYALLIAILLLLLASILSLSIGSGGICLPWQRPCSSLLSIRLPRLLASLSAGASLAFAGLVLQNLTRNPLAEPYILGLSSGALAFVSISLLVLPIVMNYSYMLSLIAFLGSITAYALTLVLAETSGGRSTALVLAGIAVNIVFTGVAEVFLYLVQSLTGRPLLMLLIGTLAYTKPSDAYLLIAIGSTTVILAPFASKPLNAIIYGDIYSEQLGYDPRWIRRVFASYASLLTGATVALVGIIGFIGLVSPHIARIVLKTSDSRYTIPLTIINGSLLLVLSDILSRIASISIGVGELPVGVYTSLLGGSFLAYLIASRMRGEL